jgi:hypothetical protein
MAQVPCESSLRPDWLSVSFKSGTSRHQQTLFEWIQDACDRYCPSGQWDKLAASRYFDNAFQFNHGVSFSSSASTSSKNPGMSLMTFTGEYFALSSVYEQMRLFTELLTFKGRYHFTRLDVQVTTLEPSQSAEQIVEDVAAGDLWVKGYKGWEAKGIKDINGQPTDGLSAYFGSATSDRRAVSYNKAAEQKNWPVTARRDEIHLRADWANEHSLALATALAGAATESQAKEIYETKCSEFIVQHMQYLDLKGTPKPRPQNWARGKKAPKWWSETLEQRFEPVELNRRPESEIEVRFGHMKTQWARTFAEYLGHRVVTGKSESFFQATIDASLQLFQYAKEEDILRVAQELPEGQREHFLAAYRGSVNLAASHSEHVL